MGIILPLKYSTLISVLVKYELIIFYFNVFRYRERGNIEVHFFNIQTKLKSNGQRHWVPPEGKLVSDIERAWVFLEKAEHDRELALREEMIRCADVEVNSSSLLIFFLPRPVP